jgi:hypothetical protein
VKDAVYLNARGLSFAILTSGPWDEVAPFVEFMGYTQPWYSLRDVEAPVGGEMGHIVCFLRNGDRVFLTYSPTGRGNEPVKRVPRPARRDAQIATANACPVSPPRVNVPVDMPLIAGRGANIGCQSP